MNNKPLVCICIPAYNAEFTIKETLESIVNQTYENLVVIVVDNCSTDNTAEIVRSFNDERITLHQNTSNIGAEANFNRCIDLAYGDYTAIFHADDVYEKDMVEQQVTTFIQNPKLGLVLTAAQLIDEHSKPLSVRSVPATVRTPNNQYNLLQLIKAVMEYGNFMFCPSAMVKTSIYKEEIKSWRGDLFGSSADLDIWLRIAKNHPVAIIPQPLLHYRISKAQFTEQMRRTTQRAELFKVMDYYLQKPLSNSLSRHDFRNYQVQEFRDKVVRALNWYLQQQDDQALLLTKNIFSLAGIGFCFHSKRGLKSWFLGALLRIFIVLRLNTTGRKFMDELLGRIYS